MIRFKLQVVLGKITLYLSLLCLGSSFSINIAQAAHGLTTSSIVFEYQGYRIILGNGVAAIISQDPAELCRLSWERTKANYSPSEGFTYSNPRMTPFSEGDYPHYRRIGWPAFVCEIDVFNHFGNFWTSGPNTVYGICQNPDPHEGGGSFEHYSIPAAREQGCLCGENYVFDKTTQFCVREEPCLECGCDESEGPLVGNPCNPVTGNKYQTEVDLSSSGSSVSLIRSYNSMFMMDVGFGKGWSSSLLPSLGVRSGSVYVRRSSGRYEVFSEFNGQYNGLADSDLLFDSTTNGFSITLVDGTVEHYDSDGKLISIVKPNGQTESYGYDTDDQLASVTSHFGHSIVLSWDTENHISTITSPHGGVYSYSYDDNDNLVGVTYPDGMQRTYHYEDINFPNHLTGITDENGIRYATFAYDSEGRAISTEHADIGTGSAQEKFQIDYGQ